ncbi:hypothetical protein EVAR_91876_1 [Eumeta japonica]|uniref:Uncharacterized protein n=1 Tax=Eumeta variegata TaxID=151549 RepID=A0A4C1TDK6_EUMVA|nr:hypothetical protein EVAR_91876_1 [Eumeta japonica]
MVEDVTVKNLHDGGRALCGYRTEDRHLAKDSQLVIVCDCWWWRLVSLLAYHSPLRRASHEVTGAHSLIILILTRPWGCGRLHVPVECLVGMKPARRRRAAGAGGAAGAGANGAGAGSANGSARDLREFEPLYYRGFGGMNLNKSWNTINPAVISGSGRDRHGLCFCETYTSNLNYY